MCKTEGQIFDHSEFTSLLEHRGSGVRASPQMRRGSHDRILDLGFSGFVSFCAEWGLKGRQRLTSFAKEDVSLLEMRTGLLKLEAGVST